MIGNTNGRRSIHLIGQKPASSASTEPMTREQAEQMVMAERDENERMVKWYMQQLPELVARMVSDALKANGLTMLPPAWTGQQPETPASTGSDAPPQSGDAAAPESAL